MELRALRKGGDQQARGKGLPYFGYAFQATIVVVNSNSNNISNSNSNRNKNK